MYQAMVYNGLLIIVSSDFILKTLMLSHLTLQTQQVVHMEKEHRVSCRQVAFNLLPEIRGQTCGNITRLANLAGKISIKVYHLGKREH